MATKLDSKLWCSRKYDECINAYEATYHTKKCRNGHSVKLKTEKRQQNEPSTLNNGEE